MRLAKSIWSRWLKQIAHRLRLAARFRRARRRLAHRSAWARLRLLPFEDRVVPTTITWSNPAGGDWNTGANWVGGIAPSATDDAVIPDFPGTPTITFSGNTTVHSVVSAERIFFDGGRIWTISADSSLNGGLDLLAASQVVTGGILTLAGTSSWADGTFSGTGSVRQTGTMTLGTGNHVSNTTFNNEGTINQTGGTLGLGAATSAFVNKP